MGLKDLLRLVTTEIIRFKKMNTFLVLNFALGLIGFFLLLIFQQSLSQQTAEKAQTILGGDLSISARHGFTDLERGAWEKIFKFEKKSQEFSLFAMLRFKEQSKLVNVIIFDDAYPLYGQLKLSNLPLNSLQPLVWVDPEIFELFDFKLMDVLSLGDSEFKLAGRIDDDPTRLFRAGVFAPRILIHKKYLTESKLIQPGSTYSESWNYRISPETNLQSIQARLELLIKDPVVQIETTADAAKDGNKTLKYFTDYLGLVALVALGLCFLCGSYLLQWIFQTKRKNIAIFKTLGLNDNKIILIYVLQTFFISLVSCLIAITFISALLPLVQNILSHQLNLPVELAVHWKSIIIISGLGVLGPLLMTVPQILEIFELSPARLYHATSSVETKSKFYYFWLLLSVLAFWILSIWQSQSYKIGSGFVAGILVLIFIFYFFNRMIMFLLERSSRTFSWLMQYSIKGLTRRKSATSLVFITMSLSTLVLSLLPHIKASILSEVRPEEKSQIPNLFFFDIQPDQVEKIQGISRKLTGRDLIFSPLVRSRILKINGQNYERIVPDNSFQTRESEAEARFRNRGVNLTYRSYLQPSEKIVDGVYQGAFAPKNKDELPGLSVESKYAEQVGFKLNDVVSFDVQGLEIKAKVTSFREVRWTSFQPNFFISFPTGVLEEAPQIFLASVSQVTPEVSRQFQSDVSRTLKNVSIINVTQAVQNSLKYI